MRSRHPHEIPRKAPASVVCQNHYRPGLAAWLLPGPHVVRRVHDRTRSRHLFRTSLFHSSNFSGRSFCESLCCSTRYSDCLHSENVGSSKTNAVDRYFHWPAGETSVAHLLPRFGCPRLYSGPVNDPYQYRPGIVATDSARTCI